jgi:guanylate kinase
MSNDGAGDNANLNAPSGGIGRRPVSRRGVMLVISSPSGAGKTTLSRQLLRESADIRLSVSATTRPPRPGEVDGQDYHFLSKDAFLALRDADGLLEWAEVYGNFYGTPRAPVEAALAAGQDVLFDVDWQGADALRDTMPDDVVTVFILPPSVEVLAARLRARPGQSEEQTQKRLAATADDIRRWISYDFVVVNDDLGAAYAELVGILRAERVRRTRCLGLSEHVAKLLDGLD